MASSQSENKTDIEAEVHQMDISNHFDDEIIKSLKEVFEKDVLVTLIDSFLTNSLQHIESMEKYLHANEYEDLVRQAHKLKGSSGNLGAAMLFERARTLEEVVKNKDSSSADGVASVFALLKEEHQYILSNLKQKLIE